MVHRDTANRADPYIEPNSCFSDFSDSLNSLNSVKILLHLGKTPLACFTRIRPLIQKKSSNPNSSFYWLQWRRWFLLTIESDPFLYNSHFCSCLFVFSLPYYKRILRRTFDIPGSTRILDSQLLKLYKRCIPLSTGQSFVRLLVLQTQFRPIHTKDQCQRQRWCFEWNTLISIGMFRQSDANADTEKWLQDPFQASKLASSLPLTLTLTLRLGVKKKPWRAWPSNESIING